MPITQDVHHQFAEYFNNENLKPYFYLLSKKLSEGHICLNLENIEKEELPDGYSLKDIKKISGNDLLASGNEIKPLVINNDKLYLHRYFYYETLILNAVKAFTKTFAPNHSMLEHALKNPDLLKKIFQHNPANSKEVNWQNVAVIQALTNHFTIITGGPGTGKTTTVAKILSNLFYNNPALKVALAAPTGKAAARMAESLKATSSEWEPIKENFSKLEPFTIHRLLGYKKNSIHFKHNKDNPLNYDVIIIDEASMIDIALFAKLLEAIEPDKKLILLGDKNQLASVEAGSLFGDLCMAQSELNYLNPADKKTYETILSKKEFESLQPWFSKKSDHPLFGKVIELQKSYRFSDEEGIGKFSKAILENKAEDITMFFKNEDPKICIDPNYSKQIFHAFISGYEAYLKEKDIAIALKKLNNLRVLCALREGERGVREINKRIEKYLKDQKLIFPGTEFYENRPILITKNNYELQLFNGDIGIVRKDEDDNNKLKLWFENKDGGLKKVYPGSISHAETVFAMTVHKSQGSEFNEVLVMLPDKEDIPILTRELIYTSVTRAKQKVIIQSPHNVLLAAAKSKVVRGSGLADRFQKN